MAPYIVATRFVTQGEGAGLRTGYRFDLDTRSGMGRIRAWAGPNRVYRTEAEAERAGASYGRRISARLARDLGPRSLSGTPRG